MHMPSMLIKNGAFITTGYTKTMNKRSKIATIV